MKGVGVGVLEAARGCKRRRGVWGGEPDRGRYGMGDGGMW